MPLFTGSPATEHEGASTVVKTVCCAGGIFACFWAAAIFCCSALIASTSGAIPLGVMSGVPVMNSFFRFLFTVCPPHAPRAIATTPKTMRTPPATNPPISNAFFICATPLGVGTPLTV